eukprot:jgi/Phyca11/19739/fgenesh1_pg.PHYCAscaffold_51_\
MPHDELRSAVDAQEHDLEALVASAHVRYVQSCRDVFCSTFYPLSDVEIRALEANGNSAADWGNVRKTNAELLQTSHIRQCSFHGQVTLGCFTSSFSHDVDGIPMLCGVYNSALSNVVVLDDALILERLLSDVEASQAQRRTQPVQMVMFSMLEWKREVEISVL